MGLGEAHPQSGGCAQRNKSPLLVRIPVKKEKDLTVDKSAGCWVQCGYPITQTQLSHGNPHTRLQLYACRPAEAALILGGMVIFLKI